MLLSWQSSEKPLVARKLMTLFSLFIVRCFRHASLQYLSHLKRFVFVLVSYSLVFNIKFYLTVVLVLLTVLFLYLFFVL
jgi:hypothetical protein